MSSQIRFVKMHGAGNDFIMINAIDGPLDLEEKTIAALCSRHRGIGADGLIIIRPGESADFRMVYHNSDGGEADMCGNGARCAARFAYEAGIASTPMRFETSSGVVEAEIDGELVMVGIGEVRGVETGMRLEGVAGDVQFADSGVPHAIVLHEEVTTIPDEEFMELAKILRWHSRFEPKGVNVNLVTIRGLHEVVYRTYERGVEGETEACGTGAAALSVVTAHLGLTAPPVTCITSGGDAIVVDFVQNEGGATACSLLGPAISVFEGSFSLGAFGTG